MQIDQIAFLQGVTDAVQENPLCQDLAEEIYRVVDNISYPGPVGRDIIEFYVLLVELAVIEAKPLAWALMWPHLGKSLGSAITVAN